MMIKGITDQLLAQAPTETLYHYTSFRGLMGIVESGCIWASDIRYMNDSAELRHTVDLIRKEAARRIRQGSPHAAAIDHFAGWVGHRITNGHMQFAASLRANGNLLSQWRGYSSPGKGVSIGFDPAYLLARVKQQGWRIGRCIYEPEIQQELINQVLDSIELWLSSEAADEVIPEGRFDAQHTAWQQMLAEMETDLLLLATILKHPSFREEEEWRVVSPTVTDFLRSSVRFREGTSMLVPYLELNLRETGGKPLRLAHLFLGPTPNRTISMNSLSMFLSSNGIEPDQGVSYCQIPYRQ